MNKRFASAMASYVVLAILAALTLKGDGTVTKMRYGVWILLAGFAFKTYIAHRTQR